MSVPASAHLPMPRWAYVPGETDEADADYETLAQAKLLVPSRFRDYVRFSFGPSLATLEKAVTRFEAMVKG